VVVQEIIARIASNLKASMKKYKRPINIRKKCLTSLAIREMKIQRALRFYLTPLRMATTKKTNNKCC
jgi:exonuclease VII small subunit